MNSALKQRLVGAVVLMVIAIIVLPMLLRGTARTVAEISTTIPSKPVKPSINDVYVDHSKRELEVRAKVKEAQESIKESDAEEGQVAKINMAWAVQLASFSQVDNATLLQGKLKEKGYHAYTRKQTVAEGTFYRVYIGPEIQKERALALVDKIRSDVDFKLQGILLRYKP